MTRIWIADPHGVHALIDAGQRDLWVRARGWRDATEPGVTDQVQVVNGDMSGRMPYGALAAFSADLGWAAGPPPEPVDPTREQAPVNAPVAAGPTEKEQARG